MPVLNICLSYVLNFILAVFQRVVKSITGYNKIRRCHISLSFSTDTLPNRGSNYMYLIIICIYKGFNSCLLVERKYCYIFLIFEN